MKRKFGNIFGNSTTLQSHVYQEEDQQILRTSTYRFPEILIRLVNVQQDVFQAERQTIEKFVNTPRRTPRLHLQVTCCLEHLSAERDNKRPGEKRESHVIILFFLKFFKIYLFINFFFCKP